VPTTGSFNLKLKLEPGNSKIRITAKNECGEDVVNFEFSVAVPCIVPEIKLTAKEIANSNYTHELNGLITNMKLKTQVSVTVNGAINNTFDFVPTTGSFNLKLKLEQGNSKIRITAKNECGEDVENFELSVAVPCVVPKIQLTAKEIANSNFTHELNGLITNMKLKTQVSVTVNGAINNTFDFVPTTGSFNLKLKLEPGNSKIRITAKNECGEDVENFELSVAVPCIVPKIQLTAKEIANSNYTHELNGLITNMKLKTQVSVTVNGAINNTFDFVPTTGSFNLKLKLEPGNSKIRITAKNECGEDVENFELSVAVPCVVPTVKIDISEYSTSPYTHKLTGTITNISSSAGITLTIDGKISTNFQYNSKTGIISANLSLLTGAHTISVKAVNECGTAVDAEDVVISDAPCGPRFNPGNADWQFCLVTPSGTFNRNDLTDDDFSYSGNASSVFFKATAGGGDAIVNGKSHSIVSGQYYLFTGKLKVTVSTSNPGSMGQWSICIESDTAPESGVGNNRPVSPCEGEKTIRETNTNRIPSGNTTPNTGTREGNSTGGDSKEINTINNRTPRTQ
jgi:hypothetical protein